jgi:hypothetical protein
MKALARTLSVWGAQLASAARSWLTTLFQPVHRRSDVRFTVDYIASPPPKRALQVVLFGAGLAMAAHASHTYQAAARYKAELNARLAVLEVVREQSTVSNGPRSKPITADEIDAVQDVRRRLTLPWPDVFEPLEAVRPVGVRLTSIEPEPKTRMLIISGEARDYLLVLGYVASLNTASGLRDVELLRHETQTSDPQFTTAFTVTARWRTRP